MGFTTSSKHPPIESVNIALVEDEATAESAYAP
jgi:hypothetical protein